MPENQFNSGTVTAGNMLKKSVGEEKPAAESTEGTTMSKLMKYPVE